MVTMKHIFVTGGVVSRLGKGMCAAGLVLQAAAVWLFRSAAS